MARRILVDGYNLLRARQGDFEDRADALERAREELLGRLRGAPRSPGEEIVVVFDGRSGLGRAGRERWGAIEARFSREPGGADRLILELVRAERDRSRLLVVTTDGELASEARALGARVTSSAEFAASLEKRPPGAPHPPSSRPEKPPAPRGADLERWQREFERRDGDEE